MALVKLSCPHCKFVIQPYSVPSYDFGDPRCKCPKCNGTYIATNIIEWDLLSPIAKPFRILGFYFHWVLGPLVAAGVLAFIGSALAQSTIDYFDQTKASTGHILFFGQFLLYYPVLFYWMYWDDHAAFWNAIKASKLRTSNPEYKKEISKYFKQGSW
ncbi:MAG: hypothetical protein Q8P40_01915 [Nitrospirota bacterium]|nr:hypothetical protein [Nitrospirota bacterium]